MQTQTTRRLTIAEVSDRLDRLPLSRFYANLPHRAAQSRRPMTASGMLATYTAPATMPANTTVMVTATAVADKTKSSSATLIPTGSISGSSVGVDYYTTGNDLNSTAFLSTYNNPSVHQTVQVQLHGMADRGATLMHTRIG